MSDPAYSLVFDDDEDNEKNAYEFVADPEPESVPTGGNGERDQAIASGAVPAPKPNDPPAHEDESWLKKLAETGQDLSIGALKGGTAGFDDELFGLAGFDPEAVREVHADAEKRSPWASRIGDVAGSLVLPVGKVAQGASWAAKVGMAALNGALHGGLRGAGESEGEDLEQRAIDALAGAETGAAVGGAVGVGAAAVGGALKGTANVLGKGADKSRLAAYGVGPEVLEAEAQRATAAARAGGNRAAYVTPEEAGQSLVRDGEALVPPNRLAPISSGEYAKRFAGQADTLNTGIEDSIETAAQRGARMPEDPRGQVSRALYDSADDAHGSAYGAGQGDALSSVAHNIEQGRQQFTPQDIRAQKIGFDQNAFKGVSREDSLAGEANLAAANEYRQMLQGFVGEGGEDVAEQFANESAMYGTAATLRESAAAQANKAAAGGGWVPGLVGATGGAIAGGMLGGGLGLGAGAAAGYAMRRGIAGNAADLGANVARMGQNAFEGGASGLNWVAQQAPTAAQQAASMYQGRRNDQRDESGPSGGETALDEGRGQDAAYAVQVHPDVLGSYASQFDLKDADKVSATYERLYAQDDNFRRNIAPQIQRLTANR